MVVSLGEIVVILLAADCGCVRITSASAVLLHARCHDHGFRGSCRYCFHFIASSTEAFLFPRCRENQVHLTSEWSGDTARLWRHRHLTCVIGVDHLKG